MGITIGLLIPLLGTMLGAAFVFFMKKYMSPRLQKSLLGFAIQNIPEGAIISMPMCAEGNSKTRSFLIGSPLSCPICSHLPLAQCATWLSKNLFPKPRPVNIATSALLASP